MSVNIGYHTRLYSNNAVKVVGGSFGGQIDMETVERLVKAHFSVKIKPSGSGVFVDKEGREVSLYLSVDPLKTTTGKAAKTEYCKRKVAEYEAEAAKEREIEELMLSLSADEILEKLRSKA